MQNYKNFRHQDSSPILLQKIQKIKELNNRNVKGDVNT